MNTSLSDFSRWALEPERTVDERYTIWLICEEARIVNHALQMKAGQSPLFRVTGMEFYKELFLHPVLVTRFSESDTELAALMIPHIKKFPHQSPCGHETRPIRDLGALRFFTALEELPLGVSEVRRTGCAPWSTG